MKILRQLLFYPNSTFGKLNIDKVPSDQFAYHIRTLVEWKLVNKENSRYSLTLKGKEFANRMDTQEFKMEKQPKISVLIIPKTKVKGRVVYMVQTRLKEPYYGYKGFMAGKIRYGEAVTEAAARELREEAGLEAIFRHVYVLHEMVYDKSGNMLEDKFFNVIEAIDIKGELQSEEGTQNTWMTEDEFINTTPLFHNELDIFRWYKEGDSSFKEHKYYIEGF